MSGKRYTEEFKVEAVKQIIDNGYSVQDAAKRLGINPHSLYAWRKKYGNASTPSSSKGKQQTEIRRLKAELKRVTEERDILKKATAYFAKESL